MRGEPPVPIGQLPLDEAPLAFVDVETTGLSPWSGDRICEVGIVRCRGRVEVGRLTTLVNPLRPISPGAFRVNGITTAMVATAPAFDRIAPDVRQAIEGAVIVAHNAPFDVGFLARELTLAGEPAPVEPILDTVALARRNFRFPSNRLDALAAQLGIPPPGHRALSDALTVREVLFRLVGRLFGTRRASVSDVLRGQGVTVLWPGTPDGAGDRAADLADAARAGLTLELTYLSGDGQLTERLVDPLEVTGHGSSLAMVAFCHLRQEQRTFRLDRVVRWKAAGQAEVPPRGI